MVSNFGMFLKQCWGPSNIPCYNTSQTNLYLKVYYPVYEVNDTVLLSFVF